MENFINDDWLGILVRTIGIFVWAFILLRLTGRKRLAHLTYIDLLLIVAFGSAVGDVMIYGEDIARFSTSMIALGAVTVVVKILDEVASRSQLINRLVVGKPHLIIDKGKTVKQTMDMENYTEEELLSQLRHHNVDAISKVRSAYIEPDGQLTVSVYKRYR
jgi:uncharacterized membrane protein YcaP (DUF421 family)